MSASIGWKKRLQRVTPLKTSSFVGLSESRPNLYNLYSTCTLHSSSLAQIGVPILHNFTHLSTLTKETV